MKKFFTLIAAMVASSSMMAQEWTDNLFGNSDVEGADMSWFAVKNNTPGGTEDPEIKTGETLTAVEGKGVNGSKAIEIVSYALTDVDGDHNNAWQAQFWIVLPKKPDGSNLEVTDKIKVSFDCRAESDYFSSDDAPLDGLISIDTQAHGTPGNYNHYQCIGTPTFGQEWSTYEAEAQVAGEWMGEKGEGFLTIAFNLSAVANYDVRYYIDNIVVQYEKVDEAQVVYWKPIVTNGDFEGDNTTNYVVRIYQQGDSNPVPEEGIGYDESRGIKVTVPAKVVETWDSQFFISFNEDIPANDVIKVSFDYKASENVGENIDTQAHGQNPGDYNHYQCIGNITPTTEWQHYEYTQSVTSDMSKEGNLYKNIAFNLAHYDHEVTVYFDNITVKHKVLVPAGENPSKIALEEYIQGLDAKYNMDNLAADKSNEAVRTAFSEAYTEAMSLGDEDDFDVALDKLSGAEGKYAASVKDYKTLANFIALINEKAAQAEKMGDDYADLKDNLEKKAEPLQAAYDAEQWTREEINAAVDNQSVYDMVAEAVKPAMKAGDDVTIVMNNSNYAWGSANWTGNVTTRVNSAERWHTSFDVYQTIANMPKGAYTLKFKGFQRHDTNDEGEVGQHEALVYANESAKLLIECGDDAEVVPSSMETAREAFDNGLFENEFAFVMKEAGDLKIGVKGTNGLNWVIWSDFQLVYNGTGAATMASAIQDQIERTEAVLADLEDNLNEPTVEKAQETIFQAGKLVEGIATASEDDCNKMIASLIDVIAEMQDANKLMNAVSDAYTNFLASYDEFADNAADDIKARAEKAAASFEDDSESYYGKMTAEELKAYVAELQFLTGALKVDKDAKNATDENPFDLTAMFENPDFEDYATVGANANYPGWAGSGFGTGGGTAGPVAERWNQSNGFDTYVKFTGLPEGTYTLSCDGAYRTSISADWDIAYAEGTTDNEAFLYAKTSVKTYETAIHNIAEGKMTAEEAEAAGIDYSANCSSLSKAVATGEVDEEGNEITANVTYYFPDQLFTADQWIQAGKYLNNNVTFVVGADGEATVGVHRKGAANDWCFLDNFKLMYFGSNSKLEPTAIEAVEVAKAVKAIYTISGVRVQSAAKPGLYIVNGKKIVVK